MNNWLIRSGQGGYLVEDFLRDGIIALGWNEIGPLESSISKYEVKDRFAESHEDWSEGKINQCAGQLLRFLHHVHINDCVITYDSSSRQYYIGKILSDYIYDETKEYHHTRKVEWDKNPISRDLLSLDTRNSLGSILTLSWVRPHLADEIKRIANGEVNDVVLEESITVYGDEEFAESLQNLKEDVVSKSNELTKDLISKLTWEETENLVAGIFRAMGYKTRMTSRGGDLGSDIIASPDSLGMKEPRIKIEVKKRSKDKISADEIRSFVGGLREYNKGVYVTTLGFSKEAKYEAERANFPITLIDSNWLVELITEYYEILDPEIKALVPMKKIYWPI